VHAQRQQAQGLLLLAFILLVVLLIRYWGRIPWLAR
jgi:hypothetical protein